MQSETLQEEVRQAVCRGMSVTLTMLVHRFRHSATPAAVWGAIERLRRAGVVEPVPLGFGSLLSHDGVEREVFWLGPRTGQCKS